ALRKELADRKDLIQPDLAPAKGSGSAESNADGDPRKRIVLDDMDWVAEGDMVPPTVQQAMFKLEPGETSDLIKSNLGLHVVKVVERVQGQQGTFEQARPQIEAMLFEKGKEAIFEQLKQNMKM
ncbi:MAG: peptidylprolyl isomerase, partial [Patescibacteria group bacterium]